MKTISSGFVVLNQKGQVLLGMVDNHNSDRRWTVFKGGTEGNESLIETAIRELKEETGIDVAVDDRLNKNISTNYIYKYSLRHKDVYIFMLNDKEGVLNDFEFSCDSFWGDSQQPEISGYKWVDIKGMKDYIFPSQRGLAQFLQRYRK